MYFSLILFSIKGVNTFGAATQLVSLWADEFHLFMVASTTSSHRWLFDDGLLS